MGSGFVDPRFIDLGTSWRSVVSFTPLLLYPRGKSPQYPLDRRLGGPQYRSGRRGGEKNLALPGIDLRPLRRPVRSQSLCRLRFPDSCLILYVNICFFISYCCWITIEWGPFLSDRVASYNTCALISVYSFSRVVNPVRAWYRVLDEWLCRTK
jgi:hypothetical protein